MSGDVSLDYVDDGVAVITLCRADVRNAFRSETWIELREAAEQATASNAVRAIVVTGEGGYFSSGGDVRTMGSTGSESSGVFAPVARLQLAQAAARVLHASPKPVIAAVEGYAIGVGWSVALLSDLLICSRTAWFDARFFTRAVVPDAGFSWLLANRVGEAKTLEILLSSRPWPATELAELGLITELVEAGGALGHARARARAIATMPADVVRLTKQLVRGSATATFEESLRTELVSWALAAHGANAAEGRNAFLEKRDPQFNADSTPEA